MYSLQGENERRTQVKIMTCMDDGTWMRTEKKREEKKAKCKIGSPLTA